MRGSKSQADITDDGQNPYYGGAGGGGGGGGFVAGGSPFGGSQDSAGGSKKVGQLSDKGLSSRLTWSRKAAITLPDR